MTNHSNGQTRLRYSGIITFLFYVMFAATALKTLFALLNLVICALSPESAVEVINTGTSYYYEGVLGYSNLSFEYLGRGSLTAADAAVDIANGRLYVISVSALILLAYMIPLLVLMHFGRRIIKIFRQSYTPFTEDSSGDIRTIGGIMIVIGMFSKLIIQGGVNIINFDTFLVDNPMEYSWIMAGIFTLMLADIFAKGCVLQREVDETL